MGKLLLESTLKEATGIKVYGFEIYPFDWYDLETERGALKLEDVPYEVRRELARQILKHPSNLVKKVYNPEYDEEESDEESSED